MIRDRIVVGIQSQALSERLQLKSDLTLEEAVIQARQLETVKAQQPLLRQEAVVGEKYRDQVVPDVANTLLMIVRVVELKKQFVENVIRKVTTRVFRAVLPNK